MEVMRVSCIRAYMRARARTVYIRRTLAMLDSSPFSLVAVNLILKSIRILEFGKFPFRQFNEFSPRPPPWVAGGDFGICCTSTHTLRTQELYHSYFMPCLGSSVQPLNEGQLLNIIQSTHSPQPPFLRRFVLNYDKACRSNLHTPRARSTWLLFDLLNDNMPKKDPPPQPPVQQPADPCKYMTRFEVAAGRPRRLLLMVSQIKGGDSLREESSDSTILKLGKGMAAIWSAPLSRRSSRGSVFKRFRVRRDK
jgi:hypothetical protein